MEFVYWAVAAGEWQHRRVVPVETFREQDHWYLRALDEATSSERTFRVDRMERIAPTGKVRTVDLPPRTHWFSTSDDAREVVLKVDAPWLWMLERYPYVEIERGSSTAGTTIESTNVDVRTVRLVVSNERWLRRLLLRLGPHVEVIEPRQWSELGREAAASVLGRYDSGVQLA